MPAAPFLTNRRLRRRLPVISVLFVVLIGLVLILLGHWRRGSVVVGGAAVLGAVLRATVGDDWVGVLAVRSKTFDITFLLTLAAVFVTAAVIGD